MKMKTKSFILIILFALWAALQASASLTAPQIMQRVAKTLTQPASTTVTFSLKSGSNSGQGTMTMCKQRFTFAAAGISVWYDGKTQWTLNRSAKEVSVTIPDAAELAESNPFVIISDYARHYDCRLAKAPKGQYRVELTPKSKGSAIRSASLTVRASDMQPLSISATLSSGSAVTITVASVKHGQALPVSYFTFNPLQHKGYDIIDLR